MPAVSSNGQDGRETLRQFQRRADRICSLIVGSDYPRIDIIIEIGNLRDECRRLYPGSMDLFEHLYEHRFDRLWEQFREEESDQ